MEVTHDPNFLLYVAIVGAIFLAAFLAWERFR